MVATQVRYSEEIAEAICEELIEGKSYREICLLPGMPNRTTIFRWLDAHPEFAAKCARARELQADFMDDLVQQVAAEVTAESAPAARVKLAAYQWRAEKLNRSKYGQNINVEHSGSIDVNIRDMGREDLILELQALALRGAPVPDTLLSAPVEEINDAEFEDDWSDLA